jgi:thiol-disulfide isomerase/thioredoxin
MWRAILVTGLSLCLSTTVWAQESKDEKKPATTAAQKTAAEKLKENPADAQAFSAYLNEVMLGVARIIRTDPKGALKKLDEMEALVAQLPADTPAARSNLSRASATAKFYRTQISVQDVPLAELAKKVTDNPDDAEALSQYTTKLSMEISPLARVRPDEAKRKLEAAKAVMNKIAEGAKSDAMKSQLASAKRTLASLETQVMPLAELGKKLANNPEDYSTLISYANRISTEISPLARTRPDEATQKLDAAKAVLTKVAETTKNANVKRQLESINRTLASLEKSIEAGKKLTELIGKDAAPLKVETWVNGSPLTDGDLKGKVVFLDFWAVWCGPCIATFPHLREWNEKYGDKGLVMIGVTNYYEFTWDDEAKRGKQAKGTTHDQEHEMLLKFAEHHGLKHRFAIEADRSLSEFYGVTGIPHVVVIDQLGKVRLMKVGSGDANAKEIDALLEKLLANNSVAGQ